MIRHTCQVIEFFKLQIILSGYSTCLSGQSTCISLKPSNYLEVIGNELKLVSEMKLLLQMKGFSSCEGLMDIKPILKNYRAEKEILLNHPSWEEESLGCSRVLI